MLLWRLIFYCLGHIAKRAIRHWTDHQGDRETGSSGLLHMATIASNVIHGFPSFLSFSFFVVSHLSHSQSTTDFAPARPKDYSYFEHKHIFWHCCIPQSASLFVGTRTKVVDSCLANQHHCVSIDACVHSTRTHNLRGTPNAKGGQGKNGKTEN